MSVTTGSLLRRQSPLSDSNEQIRILESTKGVPSFAATLSSHGYAALAATGIETLQLNLGKLCNQTCAHCHVDAGPDRAEVMTREVAEACLSVLERTAIPKVDVTGGAPELNPSFRWIVERARGLGRHVMDRCNLTVLLQPSQEDLPEFLAAHQVEVICSLPYYQERETDRQRGHGVFARSIEALRRLNALGYGREGTGLVLNLVYNPVGAFLPAPQKALEADFKNRLDRDFGVTFSSLYAITNMPISRFLDFLFRSGNYERYMERLVRAFNPGAVPGLMCRYTLSVGWDGRLYDCDFNQMLELTVNHGAPAHIRDFDPAALGIRRIVTGRHCYGCTAGAGSSCGGATT